MARPIAALLVLSLAGVAHAAPVERRLHVAQAEASSYDKNDYNRFEENYLPLYVADDDPTTAWTEGVPGDGVGQWLRLRFSSMKGATKVRLRIRNGYQKSHKLFLANERARKVTFKLLPSGTTVDAELTDTEGWQEVTLSQGAGTLAGLEMKIDSVYKGAKYEDLCISDVQIFVTAETPDNPAFEKAVFDKVKKWKEDRVSAAHAFAQAAGHSPVPIASSYDVTREDNSDNWQVSNEVFGALKDLDVTKLGKEERTVAERVKAWLDKGATAFEPVSLSTSGQAKLPTVDGMCAPTLGSCEYDSCDSPITPYQGMPLLRTDNFKVIEAQGHPPVASALDDTAYKKWKGCHSSEGATLAWAVRTGDERRTRALILVGCGMVEGREGRFLTSTPQLLAYDDDGQLRVLVTSRGLSIYTWKGTGANARVESGTYATPESKGKFTAAAAVAAVAPAK
jgi:hypothetical protein